MTGHALDRRATRADATPDLTPDRPLLDLLGPGGLASAAQADELRAIQLKGDGEGEAIHEAAAHGISGPGGPLPHGERIQAAFGRHDVSDVQAHVGGAAAEAAMLMNAQAYATGRSVAFAETPDLHTAAHEAAHVVQQRGGVSLKGGVGQTGDTHERHADAVADAVVAGRSAEGLLDRYACAGDAPAVQRQEAAPNEPTKAPGASEAPPAEDEKAPAEPAKTTLVVRWSGKFGGDLSARVTAKALGGARDTATATVADPDGPKGGGSQTLQAKLALSPAARVLIEVTPTATAPEDRYRPTRREVKRPDPAAKESHHAIELPIQRTNEKNVVDVWEARGIDPKKALKVHPQTLLGHRVQLNDATKPTVDKTNAALGKLDAASQQAVRSSIARIGGYNRRTTSKGTFSNHSVGCAIDINYNGDTKQNHHFYKSHRADAKLLAFVQRVVRTDKALAGFDVWQSKGADQLRASQAFERQFPGYLRALLGDAAPLTAPSTEAPPPDAPKAEAPPPTLDLAAVTPAVLTRAIAAQKDPAKAAELRLIEGELDAIKAWVVGAKVNGQDLVGLVPLHEKLLQVMLDGGWGWGGDWSTAKDYMHFEDRAAMDGLKKEAGGDGQK